MAHGYWIEIEGNNRPNETVTVKMFYGDYPVGERLSGKPLDKMKDIKVYVTSTNGLKQEIPMTQTTDYWEGTFRPQAEGIYEITGINDTREVQDWSKHDMGITRPIQYLKTTYQVGHRDNGKAEELFLDVAIKKLPGNTFETTVLKNGKALTGQKVIVTGYGTNEQELVSDKKGKIIYKLDKPGLYILSIDWVDKKPGEYKGKPYETVRHRLDYSIYKQ
jgi:uncharacterized GH25 family protein